MSEDNYTAAPSAEELLPDPVAAAQANMGTAQPVSPNVVTPSTPQAEDNTSSDQVAVRNPNGELVTIPATHLDRALEQGYEKVDPKEVHDAQLQEKYGSGWQQAATALEHGASAATFGLSTAAERLAGVSGEDIRGRSEANPVAAGAGTIAGLAGTAFLPGFGEAAIANDALKAGKAAEEGVVAAKKAFDAGMGSAEEIVQAEQRLQDASALIEANPAAKALNPFSATSVMNKAGRAVQESLGIGAGAGDLNALKALATRGAVENSLFSAGDILSRTFAGDPPATVGSALTEIGLSGLIGGGTSAAFGTIPMLWKASNEAKLVNTVGESKGVIRDIVDRVKERLNNPDPVGNLVESAQKAYNSIDEGSRLIYENGGLKETEIRQLLPKNSDKAFDEAAQFADKGRKLVSQLKEDSAAPHIVNQTTAALNRFENSVLKANEAKDSYELYSSINTLKQELRSISGVKKGSFPNEAEAYAKSKVGELWGETQKNLENEKVWGGAGKAQREFNEAFSQLQGKDGPLAQFKKTFMENVGGEDRVSPGRMQTYLNQLGKPNAEIKQEKMLNFLNGHNDFHKAINDAYSRAGAVNPLDRVSTQSLEASTGKLSRGAKIADAFINHSASRLGGEGLGAGIGATVGAKLGAPGIGALIGEHTLGGPISAVLPSIAKTILESMSSESGKINRLVGVANNTALKQAVAKALDGTQQLSGAGIKAAAMYSAAALAGELALDKNSKAIFNDKKDIEIKTDTKKLQKNLEHHSSNPIQSLQNIGGDIHHYFPDHQGPMSSTAGTAVSYLQSQKFNPTPVGTLDKPIVQTAANKAKYERTLATAEYPLNILGYIKGGQLTPKDVQDLQAMYPAVYDKMVQKVNEAMMSHVQSGGFIPYATRLSLSTFTGQPLDSTMTSASIIAAQPQPQNPNPPPQKNMKNLGKIAQNAQTPGQARQSEAVSGDKG